MSGTGWHGGKAVIPVPHALLHSPPLPCTLRQGKQAITDCTRPFPYQIFCCHPPFNPPPPSIPHPHLLRILSPPFSLFPFQPSPPSRTGPKRNQEKRTERQPKPQTQKHKLAVPPQRPPGKSHQKKRGRPAHTHRNRRSLITTAG